ncbi:unnamed protein product [Adineta steineri]|uniref:Neuropeptide Y n=1 Tax=Adineta steineri TaxID=433720 RepID=A0A815LZK8_9BILA|nr:unnamed protein product [Adineta steineri]
MHSSLSYVISLLIFSIISIQLTSSASFPHPPHFPSPDASPEEWSSFLKLLHNYYAIMSRPRYGKRSQSIMTHHNQPLSLLQILKRDVVFPSLLEDEIYENTHNVNDYPNNMDDAYILIPQNWRRR